MKISCITNSSFCVPKTSVSVGAEPQKLVANNSVSIDSKQNDRSQITFGNRPWVLNPYDYGVSRTGSVSGNEAIRLYSQLRSGNYLDIGDDKFDFYNCNRIREENLSFLDRVNYSSDKRQFINHYEELTGFPNLQEVSRRIQREFLRAVEQSQRDLSYSKYDVLLAGYDGVCSVGRGKAFPGSDLDKAYVILRGTGWQYEEGDIVDNFKGKLWQNTDQRILSYNHDEAAFPQVYTKEQIERLTKAVDDKDYPHRQLQINHEHISETYKEQYRLLYDMWGFDNAKYMDDYVEANPYWVKYCREFPIAGVDTVRVYNPSRENIKNVGFTLEAIREGKLLKGLRENLDIIGRTSYEMVNLSQLAALKKIGDRKPKRVARDSLMYEFPRWDLDKQFRFIKTLIKSACANNREFTTEFAKYFSKPGQDMYAPLIKALMGNL